MNNQLFNNYFTPFIQFAIVSGYMGSINDYLRVGLQWRKLCATVIIKTEIWLQMSEERQLVTNEDCQVAYCTTPKYRTFINASRVLFGK